MSVGETLDTLRGEESVAIDIRLDTFNQDLESYTDKSWLEYIENGPLLIKHRDIPRTKARISVVVTEHFDLAEALSSEFDDATCASVYLGDPAKLRQLVWGLGLAVHANQIAKMVDGNHVRWLVNTIGQKSYRYSVLVSRRQSTVELEETGEIQWGISNSETLKKRIVCAGLQILGTYCADKSIALNRRLWLKLPVSWSAQMMFLEPLCSYENTCKVIEETLSECVVTRLESEVGEDTSAEPEPAAL